MANLSGLAFPFAFLLLLVFSTVHLEALKSPRGVRGASSRNIVDKNEEDHHHHILVGLTDPKRHLETFKKDDKEEKENDAVIESAFETEEPTEPPKEEDDDKDDDKDDGKDDEEETEEPTKPPKEDDDKDDEDEETEEPTDPPSPDDDEEEVVDPEEQIDDMDEDTETAVLPSPTDAPETETISTDETSTMNETDVWSVDLAPFTIEVDYDEPITEDPGIEEYLYMEMVRGGGVNLAEIDLEMTVATVSERERRHRHLVNQVLYYTGTATFEGPPVHETEKVHSLQNQILTNEEKLSTIMAISLGESPTNFTITSITVEVTADEVVEVDGGTDGQPEDPPAQDDELSTTGLAIVLIAASIGAISLTIICLVAVKKPDKKVVEPYGGTRSMIKVSTKEPAADTVDAAEAPKEGPIIDLNKTFDTEDDQVHEEFAQNMEKHSFDGSWNKGPVKPVASVGRGSFHEVSENEGDQDSNPEDLKKELGQQLSDLQASVKAAREKTQKLLDEAKAS